MKKFFLSLVVFLASAGYVAYQATGGSAIAAAAPVGDGAARVEAVPEATASSTAPIAEIPAAATGTVAIVPVPAPVTKPAAPVPVVTPSPVPVTKPKGQYVDGTYTGSAADAYYGTVQVQAVISGGKLTAVNFLQYPSDRRTSQQINAQAMSVLKSEAIQAQSANVDAVSGATDTYGAFVQSLGSALSQAANS